MDSEEVIAEITIQSETGDVKYTKLLTDNLRFKCKRCATFCCKLGGPRVTSEDIKKLKKSGLSRAEFLDAANKCLKNTVSGSCVLLRFDSRRQFYRCTVYPYRPGSCRRYPFHIEKVGSDRFVMRLLPCNGIDRHRGALIDELLMTKNFLDVLSDLAFNRSSARLR